MTKISCSLRRTVWSWVKNALRAACIVIVLPPWRWPDVTLTNSARKTPFQSKP